MKDYRTINNPEYTLIKTKHGSKVYIPAVLFHGRRRTLHRAFTRARDAMTYRERITEKLEGK